MKIIEYEEKYIEDVRDLLVELEEYIVSIDEYQLDVLNKDYREKMVLYDLQQMHENEGKMYLALENNKVIGMILGIVEHYEEQDYLDYKCPKKGIIKELIITKKARSEGIGTILLNKLDDYFKSINCEYIALEAFAYNENDIKFYQKHGYHTRMYDMIKKV